MPVRAMLWSSSPLSHFRRQLTGMTPGYGSLLQLLTIDMDLKTVRPHIGEMCPLALNLQVLVASFSCMSLAYAHAEQRQ